MTKSTNDSEIAVKASYAVSEIIARRLKPYDDGEFVKACLEVVGDILCQKKTLISSISLSRFIVSRKIDDISHMIETKLHDLSQKFEAFSISVDESTDVVDTVELAIFIRGVNIN
jgi:ADP-ribosylglycohydrolase